MNQRVSVNEEIPALLRKYGTLTVEQLYYFMKSPKVVTAETKAKKLESMSKYIAGCKNRGISSQGAICWDSSTQCNLGMIDCVWTMIDMLCDKDAPYNNHEVLQNSFRLELPEAISFIKDNKFIIRTVSIQTDESISVLPFLQDKMYAMYGENKVLSTLLIVIRDTQMIDKIATLELTIPHKIALLEGNITHIPAITYFGS